MCAISHTQHCVTLPTAEAEYEAMAVGVKEVLFVGSVLCLVQPGVVFSIELFEDNGEGGIAVAENSLSSGKSKYIDARWNLNRDLLKTKAITANTHTRGIEITTC